MQLDETGPLVLRRRYWISDGVWWPSLKYFSRGLRVKMPRTQCPPGIIRQPSPRDEPYKKRIGPVKRNRKTVRKIAAFSGFRYRFIRSHYRAKLVLKKSPWNKMYITSSRAWASAAPVRVKVRAMLVRPAARKSAA